MTKEEHINYWLQSASKEALSIDKIFESADYVYSLFFCHLHLEKLCKALWVKHSLENIPPKTHNLMHLLTLAKIELNVHIHKNFFRGIHSPHPTNG